MMSIGMTCSCGQRMRLKMMDVGMAIIIGDQVYSADLYRCECGKVAHGTPGAVPIRPLSEWKANWKSQPKPRIYL